MPIDYLYEKKHKIIKRKCRVCDKKTNDVISGSFWAGADVAYHYWCSEECAKKERELQQQAEDDKVDLQLRIKGLIKNKERSEEMLIFLEEEEIKTIIKALEGRDVPMGLIEKLEERIK